MSELPGDLQCGELVELVTEYLEGTLSAGDLTRFELHVVLCPDCARYLQQMKDTLRAAGRLTEESLPDGARDRLLAAFRNWKRRRPRP
jgi:anti-sigma factor RsiW